MSLRRNKADCRRLARARAVAGVCGRGRADPFPPTARRTSRIGMEPSHRGAAHACRVVRPTPPAHARRRPPPGYARGRGKTNFCTAASFGQTATGFWLRIWIIVGIALGLSPSSLNATGPPYCISPPE